MITYWGAAVVRGDTAYFSQYNSVYSYTPAKDKWVELQPCEFESFGMAVVNDRVTTIGGYCDDKPTNILLCLEDQGTKWKELFTQMPTPRAQPASATTPTHLIVAGGTTGPFSKGLSTIEILNTNTLQWSSASSAPRALIFPHTSLRGERLYLTERDAVFSCSVEKLIQSCNDGGSVWTKLTNTPVSCDASLTTLMGQVIALGGSDQGMPSGVIHSYDGSTNSWSVFGKMPTPRSHTLVAVVPSKEMIIVGGMDRRFMSCDVVEIVRIS